MRSGRRIGFATYHIALGVALGAAWGVVMSFLARKGWLTEEELSNATAARFVRDGPFTPTSGCELI